MKAKYLVIFIVMFFIAQPFSAQEVYLSPSEYPEEINEYVAKHFSAFEIVSIKQDKEPLKTEYEVQLNNQVELEFDGKFVIKKNEGKTSLPASVIPQQIQDYVSQNYPSNFIIKWKKEGNNQEVELDNDLDLVFDLNGKFLRIDD